MGYRDVLGGILPLAKATGRELLVLVLQSSRWLNTQAKVLEDAGMHSHGNRLLPFSSHGKDTPAC